MALFIYRCPSTGLNVQGWIADDPTEGEAESYEVVTCTACTRVHLVNKKPAGYWGPTRINGVTGNELTLGGRFDVRFTGEG
jgi:hypothetical protein